MCSCVGRAILQLFRMFIAQSQKQEMENCHICPHKAATPPILGQLWSSWQLSDVNKKKPLHA